MSVSAPPRTGEKPEPASLPSIRGERLAGAVLTRTGPLLAGLGIATSLLAAVLVPFGGWRPWVVFPLLVLVLAALVPLVRAIPAPAAPRWTAPLCLLIALGHTWWAAATHSEHIVLRRDAGSYALFTQWIATQHRLPVTSHLDAFGGSAALADPAFRLSSPAFFQVLHGAAGAVGTTVSIVPQFLLGDPAVFSLGWWVDGWNGLLIAPAIVSGLALFAVAGLVTRLCGARWAPLAIAALALSQPVLHTARSPYSEPLALIFVAAAMSLLVDAVRVGNLGRPQARGLALAAGLAFGLAGLDRVDAVREVALTFPVAAVLALRRHPAGRPLVVGGLAGTVVAFIPALLLSRPYLTSVAGSLLPLLAGGVVLAGGSLLAVRYGRRRSADLDPPAAEPDPSSAAGPTPAPDPWVRRAPRIATGLVVLVGVVLATRPLWQTVRQSASDPGSHVVAGLQLRQGLPVDGGRTYAEHSLIWVCWYLGLPVVLAAWVMLSGLAGAAVRWWRRPGADPSDPDVPFWLGPVFVGFASTVLTLYRPGITPDHPWADRRLDVVVLPTMVIAATAFVAWAGRLARRRWPASLLLATLATACVALLLPPWLTTAPLAGKRTEQGELSAVHQVCGALHPGDVVLAVDARAANEWPQVVRGICGLPAASLKAANGELAQAAIRRIAGRITAAGGQPVMLAATPQGEGLLAGMGLTPVPATDRHTREDQRSLTTAPTGTDPLTIQVWLAPGP